MQSYKRLFSRALAAAPDRLHFAAHSHHLWPDVTREAQIAAWDDAARLADLKWGEAVFGRVWPEAQANVAAELGLPDPSSVVFSVNTHDFLLRLLSAVDRRPVRILTTDAEFHSFRRQSARWVEAGAAVVETVAAEPRESLEDRFLERARAGGFDLLFVSHVFFKTGRRFRRVEDLAALSRPEGPWAVIDGYHAFMARPVDLSAIADRVFYTSGGYKYAMAGEAAAFLHAPPGFAPRPEATGWFAEFSNLEGPQGSVGYARDASRFMGATFDATALYRLNAVFALLRAEGLTTAAVSARVLELQHRFAALIAEGRAGPLAEAEPLNPPQDGDGARFLAFRHPQAQAWKAALQGRGVITDVRDDVIRFGFGLYHDPEDVERLAAEAARLGG